MAKQASGRSGFDGAIWSVCDILRRSNCAGAMQYVPELTWVLFLRILDETEQRKGEMAKAVGSEFRHSLASPYRWQDWAAPDAPERKRLVASTTDAFYDFVNTKLMPHPGAFTGIHCSQERRIARYSRPPRGEPTLRQITSLSGLWPSQNVKPRSSKPRWSVSWQSGGPLRTPVSVKRSRGFHACTE
jgi:hypothetical protein